MVDGGLTEKVALDRVTKPLKLINIQARTCARFDDCNILLVLYLLQTVTFYFPDCGKLPPPVVQVQNVSFQYAPDKVRLLFLHYFWIIFNHLLIGYDITLFCVFSQ